MIINLFNESITRLEEVLNVRSKRHQVITANVTNQDTPGYKAKSLDFNDALKAAKSGDRPMALEKTDGQHLSSQIPAQEPISAQIKLARTGRTTKLDENTVEGEKEMTRLAENTFMYQATAQLIAGKFKGLKSAISEGR